MQRAQGQCDACSNYVCESRFLFLWSAGSWYGYPWAPQQRHVDCCSCRGLLRRGCTKVSVVARGPQLGSLSALKMKAQSSDDRTRKCIMFGWMNGRHVFFFPLACPVWYLRGPIFTTEIVILGAVGMISWCQFEYKPPGRTWTGDKKASKPLKCFLDGQRRRSRRCSTQHQHTVLHMRKGRNLKESLKCLVQSLGTQVLSDVKSRISLSRHAPTKLLRHLNKGNLTLAGFTWPQGPSWPS